MKNIEKLGSFDSNLQVPKYFILPKGNFKKIWNFFIFMICLYTILMIPLEIGMFLQYQLQKQDILNKYLNIEYIICASLLVDFIFRFITPIYTDKGDLIIQEKIIMKKYCNGFLLIDLISIFPVDLIFNSNLEIKTFYVLILMKLPRFLRIIRVSRELVTLNNPIMKVFRLFFVYYLIAHFFAGTLCYTSANLFANNNLTNDKIFEFLNKTTVSNLYTQYVNLSLLILVGNNIAPSDFTQRVIFVTMFYVGTLCEAIIFGNMAIILTQTNTMEKNKNRQGDELVYLMNILSINPLVRKEIIDYQDIVWWKYRDRFLNKKFMIELNRMLFTRVSLLKLTDCLFNVSPIFQKFMPLFTQKFASNIKQIMTHPNDVLTYEGSLDCNRQLFFIPKDGKLSVNIAGNIISILKEGDYFGEISFFLKCKRRIATVISRNISILFYLDSSIVTSLFYDFPFEAKQFFTLALTRFKQSICFMDDNLKNKIILARDNNIWNDDIITMLGNFYKKSDLMSDN